MNLLPKSKDQFRSSEYWEHFFKKRKDNFEWYGDYNQLCGILHKYTKPTNQTLMIGCGNSSLSENLYDVGFHDIVNIDISDVVIRKMTEKNKKHRPQMKWLKMDVKKMSFEDETFHAIIDKGTLDALMTDDTENVRDDIKVMFTEISRVLHTMGRYICVSLLQEHILNLLLEFFTNLCWHIRVHKVNISTDDSVSHLAVFVIVCTKFKKLPNVKSSILEIAAFDETIKRCSDTHEVIEFVKEIQYYATVQYQLSTRTVPDESVCVQLYSPDIDHPRYTLHVVDTGHNSQQPFAIFIVPKGREMEWMFSTDPGRRDLAESAKFDRLIIVTLNPIHTYENLDSINAELSTKVMELAPKGLNPKFQVPFLSVGSDIGEQTIVTRGISDLSGEFLVEEVKIDETFYRRLIFLNSLNAVQSEVRLCETPSYRRGRERIKLMIDQSYLPPSDLDIVAGLAFIHDFRQRIDDEIHVLFVGLGGGALPTFIHHHFSKIHLTVVEIDPAIASIAEQFFSLPKSDRLSVVIDDGLNVITNAAVENDTYDVVILDVDSKDTSQGVTAPCLSFIEPGILQHIHSLIAPKKGVFVTNLLCRDKEMRKSILASIRKEFHTVYHTKTERIINETIYAISCNCDTCTKNIHNYTEMNLHKMNAITRTCAGGDSSIIDLTDALVNLKLL